MINQNTNHQDGAAEVDHLLHDFFRAEMPHPWPAMRTMAVPSQARRVGSFWSNATGRFALAASIALLIAGYLTLSGFFPRHQEATGVETGPHMGGMEKKTKPPARLPIVQDDIPELVPMNITSPGKHR